MDSQPKPGSAIALPTGVSGKAEVGRVAAYGVSRIGKRTKQRFDLEILEGTKFNIHGQIVYIRRVIDRVNNRYLEIVINLDSQIQLRNANESLTDHQNHGSAKFKL